MRVWLHHDYRREHVNSTCYAHGHSVNLRVLVLRILTARNTHPMVLRVTDSTVVFCPIPQAPPSSSGQMINHGPPIVHGVNYMKRAPRIVYTPDSRFPGYI